MATVQDIYNEIDRIENAKSGIAGAIEEKGVEVPAGAKIDEYPGLVRQIQQGDTSDCVKFTPQTLTEEQKAQARENIGAGSGGGDGKMGVISQTQTWSGSGSNPRTYVMSDQVTGLIPQANIDLFESAGATFNATTGYFELNGLTDISYEEMKAIYNGSITMLMPTRTRSYTLSDAPIRTNIPMAQPTSNVSVACDGLCLFSHQIEAVNVGTLNSQNNMQDAFRGNSIRKIIGEMKVGSVTEANFNRTFNDAFSLEEVKLYNVKVSIPIKYSSLLSLTSVVYLVENAANTSAITITLHATAYARCQADTMEYTYGGNTYTGIIAYANARNITIASA